MVTESRIRAQYRIETPFSPEQAAATMAGEQSTGTFVRLPAETASLIERHAATVERVEIVGETDHPSLATRAGETQHARYHQAEVELSFPLENVGTALPNILTTVAGNLFELRELTGIRLEDVSLPAEVVTAHPGPQFGIEGTRRVADVRDRPIIGTIVKPSVGLTPVQTGRLARDLSLAGLDFIKDDELMANSPHSPFDERLREVLTGLDDAAETTGRRPLYAVNVTDELDEMLRHVDAVVEAGGNCVMVSLNTVGLSALRVLRRHSPLPIHGHRNGWGALTRDPMLGFSFTAYHQFWRLAGADHLHVNGLGNKFWEPDESVVRSAKACLAPLGASMPVMPVLSSAQTAVQADETYRRLGSSDLMYVCGGGIFGHPSGAAAGVASIRQAWDAALQGVPAAEYAVHHPELAAALQTFGPAV